MRRLGDALKQAVSEDFETEAGGALRSPLMNANRRRTFEYVAWHPCASVGEVARALGVSEPTAAWHLRKLAEAGYVRQVGGEPRRFLASGITLTPEDVARFAVLSAPESTLVLGLAMVTPGLTATDLAAGAQRATVRGTLRDLQAAGLLVAVVDGRYRRFYPGESVSALERGAPKRLRDFRRRLLRKLEEDRLAPEVRAAPGDAFEVDVHFGDERATLRLPGGSLLAGRLAQADLS